MSLIYSKELIQHAKELRTNMTRQERKLWYEFLKTYPIRFQRQKTIQQYIVDFYCHQARIAIELDGSQHYDPKIIEYDAKRTRQLNGLSVEILRFSNLDIERNFVGVCTVIHNKVQEKLNMSSNNW